MKKLSRLLFSLLALLACTTVVAEWDLLSTGLELGKFKVESSNTQQKAEIIILRIDPDNFEFKLIAQSDLPKKNNQTAKQWSKSHNLVAAINAGMFAQDYSTHIGFMRNENSVNNSHINKYQSVVAFNPKIKNVPSFQIFDLDAPDTDINKIKQQYVSVVQNLRLIKKPGENRWSQQKKRWSEAALGIDKSGNALFIFSRAPFSMHDLNKELLALDINLAAAQHLEGGPEAQLYINHAGKELEMFGSYETAFNENDNNSISWPIPNVIGVKAKVSD